jgi:hypothetical protein
VLGDRVAPGLGNAAVFEQLHRVGLSQSRQRDPQPELGQQAEDAIASRGAQLDEVSAAAQALADRAVFE